LQYPRSSYSEDFPVIAQVNYSEYDRLSEVAKAVRYYEERHTRGKVVITVEHNNKTKQSALEVHQDPRLPHQVADPRRGNAGSLTPSRYSAALHSGRVLKLCGILKKNRT
jgi:hypothetical protein